VGTIVGGLVDAVESIEGIWAGYMRIFNSRLQAMGGLPVDGHG
jgi:hypothetical protein